MAAGIAMDTETQRIFEIVKGNILAVLPELESAGIQPASSMRDLGLNSIDRADVVINSMEQLELKIPLSEVAAMKNIQDLVGLFQARLAPGGGRGAA
ncbi:MAG TPA: acyl carrier protein [Candidatus Limnocylindria bacterium]|jgi:polyketide biosynthesis acyl carrier protein|nr:acyl carrier protein [Candidatus Limnocylindria bacterium]